LIFHEPAVFVDRSFSILRRDENSSTAEDIMEIEANQFAAKRYAVSMQAMNYRIANLFLPKTW
jgi:hypothetical protein